MGEKIQRKKINIRNFIEDFLACNDGTKWLSRDLTISKHRGKIRNEDQARQLRDVSGLDFPGGITPTDIDYYLEFGNRIFIFIEIKWHGTYPPGGQKLALERLVDNLAIAEKKPPNATILFIVEHDVPTDQTIDVASCLVCRYYYRGKWFGWIDINRRYELLAPRDPAAGA